MSWPPRDWRAIIALIGSIAGAATLTGFVAWGFWLNTTAPVWTGATEELRALTNRWVLWIAAGTIALVIVGLGMAINRRSFKGKFGAASVDFEGGEADATVTIPPPPAPAPGPAPTIPDPLFGQETLR